MQSAFELISLNLESFRAYQSATVSFEQDLTILIGENGIGKTSILEAIAMGGTLRSFRGTLDRDLISPSKDFYGVTVNYALRDTKETLRFAYGKDSENGSYRRSMHINGQKANSVNDFLGRFKVVVFTPDDTDIIDRTPKERRQFFDGVLCTLYPAYLKSLQSYNRVLLQRNTALKKTPNMDALMLNAFDQEIAKHGFAIIEARRTLQVEFKNYFDSYVGIISDQKDKWSLDYQESAQAVSSVDDYVEALAGARSNDLRLRQTTRGVHRDRFYFYPEDGPRLELQQYASQGQKRTVALALKMAQYQLILQKTQNRPVLLIDDVLNELDLHRREKFLGFLAEIGQAIITTTELKGLEEFLNTLSSTKSSKVYEIFPTVDGPDLRDSDNDYVVSGPGNRDSSIS